MSQLTKSEEDLRVIWHGHSCFELRSQDAAVIFDPFLEVPGYKTLELQADLVLVSHEHDDHNARNRVRLSGKTPDIEVDVIESFHDHEQGKLRGDNKIHVVTMNGKRIAHMGDLGHPLLPEQAIKLQNLDLLLIPVGGFYTIDADEAAEIVKALKPRLTVPMHYREGSLGFDKIAELGPFLAHFEEVTRLDQPSFVLDGIRDGILVLKNPMK